MRLLLLHLGLIGSSHAYARYVEDMQNQSDEVGGVFLYSLQSDLFMYSASLKKANNAEWSRSVCHLPQLDWSIYFRY